MVTEGEQTLLAWRCEFQPREPKPMLVGPAAKLGHPAGEGRQFRAKEEGVKKVRLAA